MIERDKFDENKVRVVTGTKTIVFKPDATVIWPKYCKRQVVIGSVPWWLPERECLNEISAHFGEKYEWGKVLKDKFFDLPTCKVLFCLKVEEYREKGNEEVSINGEKYMLRWLEPRKKEGETNRWNKKRAPVRSTSLNMADATSVEVKTTKPNDILKESSEVDIDSKEEEIQEIEEFIIQASAKSDNVSSNKEVLANEKMVRKRRKQRT